MELEVRGHFDESVLWSVQGLHMGDIRFAEIQTSFKMCTIPFCMFLQFIEKGSFKAENLPVDSYSHTTAILLAFVPNPRLTDIECVGIGNVIQRCRSPLGGIDSVRTVIVTTQAPQPWLHNPGSTNKAPQPRFHNPGSTIQDPQLRLHNPGLTIQAPQPRLHNPGSTIQDTQDRIYRSTECISYFKGLRQKSLNEIHISIT